MQSALNKQEVNMSLEELIAFKVDQAISELIKTVFCEGFCPWSL